ncbi:protein containing DUF342, partial [human gut metagenome]
EPQKIEAIVAGVAEGCRQAGCALVGGETAEMPGMYAEGEYDIAEEAVNGKDGSVKNLYSKTRNKINIKEDVQGNVNYKELNMIQSIHKGDVICQITPPTLSVNGVSVTGEPIKGKDGKPPHIPAGKNTVLSEDKTKLLADIDGEVVYEGTKFNVKNLLTINHDVDNSI